MHHAEGARRMLLTPGNYGEDFIRGYLHARSIPQVKFSNFIGATLDYAGDIGFSDVLLIGHIGKLVKLAGGIMDTHSRMADCRVELFCAHAATLGADTATCRRLMDAATSDACIEILSDAGMLEAVLRSLQGKIEQVLERRASGRFRIGLVAFSKQHGLLMESEMAKQMIGEWSIE